MKQAIQFRFPQRQSLGSLFVAPRSQPESWELLQVPMGLVTKPENQPINWEWLDEARGEVTVPPDMKVKLKIASMSVGGISCLAELDPESIHLLDVSRTQLADDSLRHISHLTGLKVLELAYTAVTNAGLEQLKRLAHLESLGLTHTAITNTGLLHLESMTSLRELWLNGTLIDNEGLEHLQGLKNLMLLGLSSTRVDDEAFEELAQMKNLLRVYMFNTEITEAGAQSLRAMLPSCRVKWCRRQPGFDEDISGEEFSLDLSDELNMIAQERATTSAVQAMPEEEFWSFIELLDWDSEGDDHQVIAPCIDRLADCGKEKIYAFLERLNEKLFNLDGECFARNIGRASYKGKGEYFSRSWFLNARCCVVANGREVYEDVLSEPESMPKDFGFRALLDIADEAYSRCTGKKLSYSTKKNPQTFSNKDGWSVL